MAKSRPYLTEIERAFNHRHERVFRQSDLDFIFKSGQLGSELPSSMSPTAFTQMLLRHTKMTKVLLKSTEYTPLLRYAWGTDVAPVLLALSIRPRSFCSHGSAMWIHGLGGDERHVFVNSEQSEKPPNLTTLTQESIDSAFRNEQRKSKLVYRYRGTSMMVLNGKNSGRLEVELAKVPSGEQVEVTSLERTLVDITVRPAYAGGITHVLESFRKARGRISTEKLLRVLKAFDFIYPYHQSLGFYLKRSGYAEADLSLIKTVGIPFNFYLAHGMDELAFDEEFKVFFPQSLQ